MGYFDSFDSITSYFSSEPTSTEQADNGGELAIAASAPSPFSPATMLSSSYSIGNLCATNQPLSAPNLPNSQTEVDNLAVLADVLEELSSRIGSFTILSGFRTKELQAALKAKGEPTAAGISFHELGRAVDISPTTMGITEFFGRLLADDVLKSRFAEIAIKSSQNALHLAVNTPDDNRDPKVLGLNNEGVYARLSVDDIVNYVRPFMESTVAATDYVEAQLVGSSHTTLYLALGVAAVAAYFLMGKGK